MTLPEANRTREEKSSKEDGETLIATLDKNSTERIEVKITTWKCQDYLDIRVFYTSDGVQYHPTKKGITLNIELMPKLLDALEKAAIALKQDEKGGK